MVRSRPTCVEINMSRQGNLRVSRHQGSALSRGWLDIFVSLNHVYYVSSISYLFPKIEKEANSKTMSHLDEEGIIY